MMKNQLMKHKKTKYRSNYSMDQNQLKNICDNLCDNIESILDHFGLEYKINNKFVSMPCPIHGGDNDGAINLYYVGESYRGNWKCRTHHCDEIFKSSIIGFIRGILSHRDKGWEKSGDNFVSFDDTIKYINDNFKDLKSISSNINHDQNNFVTQSKILSSKIEKINIGVKRKHIIDNLEIPSKYFLSRGFSKDILIKYDIGDCNTYGKEMYRRAVVPVYDDNYEYMVGCSGRSINHKCDSCGAFHSSDYACPDPDNRWKYCKWKHSVGFKSQESLYNFWFAKEHIQSLGEAIVVESPGNVWKLEENNINNSVALFGSHMTDKQKMLLDTSGAMKLILILDNDDAGNKARDIIHKKCDRTYNIQDIHITKNDIAEMSSEEIQKEIKAFI